jgi:predicted DNA-binding WGR domain protein
MSWTDQKPLVATEEHLKLRWNGKKNGRGFRCHLCGHRFKVGDVWRWVFSKKYVNFFTCASCDGPDVAERWIKVNEEARQKFWWLFEDLEEANREISRESRSAYDTGYEEGREANREEHRW